MENKLERLIKLIYKKWKSGMLQGDGWHPDEEAFACFIEGRLALKENARIKKHLIGCDRCAEILSAQVRLEPEQGKQVPLELFERVKNLATLQDTPAVLEILLKARERLLEIMNTTGDVLVGQEFVPAAVLRSRQINDFKDEITILKDFKDMRVEVKIENKAGKFFNLIVIAKEKWTNQVMKDLRVTIIRDDLELESYLNDKGSVTFEHVALGKYTIELSAVEQRLASVLVEIRV